MSNAFYSRGKLILTGEYFVLEGSRALAVPLNVGQRLLVEKNNHINLEIIWESYIKNKLWFVATFNLNSLEIIDTNDMHIANYLQKLLNYIKDKSNVFEGNQAIQIRTYLDFLPEWGLGSSSSLISNLAYWANISPYDLVFSVAEGSGYDIACARSDTPILYQWKQEPVIHPVKFEPDFLDHIYFVYLGRKQDSLKSVQEKRTNIKGKKAEINRITELTKSIIETKTLDEFDEIIKEHEEIVSKSLQEETVKSKYFSDFQGAIKSLGAWGGDFILVTHRGNPNYVKNYFNKKGLEVIFPYKELVL